LRRLSVSCAPRDWDSRPAARRILLILSASAKAPAALDPPLDGAIKSPRGSLVGLGVQFIELYDTLAQKVRIAGKDPDIGPGANTYIAMWHWGLTW